jgi:hypothetical protein
MLLAGWLPYKTPNFQCYHGVTAALTKIPANESQIPETPDLTQVFQDETAKIVKQAKEQALQHLQDNTVGIGSLDTSSNAVFFF